MQKFLLPIASEQDLGRARALLKAIRQRVADGRVTANADLVREALGALEEVYGSLTQPVTQERILTGHRDPQEFNLLASEVQADLETAFKSAEKVNGALLSSFNYTATLVAQLDARMRAMTSRSQDLQHVTGVFVDDVITVGDNFVDNSKVDAQFALSGDAADVLPGTGSMLARLEAASVSDDAEISVQANHPLYEGKFYAHEGEAEPEGGKFHFASARRGGQIQIQSPTERPTIEEVMTTGNIPEGVNGNIVYGEPGQATESGLQQSETDNGASEEDKQAVRARILDGNADSYWQAEHVVDLPDIDLQNLTYQGLVAALSGPGIDKIDFEVTLVLKLTGPQIVNFIVLDPLQVGDGTWMEVTDISTSMNANEWAQVEGLHDHNFENVLTDEANEELTDEEVAITLAPNKYEYSGKGVWTFPAVECLYIRVKLLQRVPTPAPYDIQVLETSRVLTATHRGHRGTETTNEEQRRVIRLSYLDTLRTKAGKGGLPRLQIPGKSEVSGGQSAMEIMQDVLDPGRLLHSHEDRSQTTHEYSAETVSDEWIETKWDKARYAVGVRDLRVFSYRFADHSERVSTQFRTPRPIEKVTLLTDELIPREFNAGAQVRPWILYWVSFDNGVTWTPLSPTSSSVVNRIDGKLLPVAVNVNSGIPEEEQEPTESYVDANDSQQIRFKWRLERPSSMDDRTPVLKNYRLQISIEGGLS